MVNLKKKLILLDIDGVVANDTHRVQYALDKDWGTYFQLAAKDDPLVEGLELAKKYAYEPNIELQYLTGRRIDLYETTVRWLTNHGFPNATMITMRGFAHRDILAKYKAGVIRNALEGGHFRSVKLYEDDPAVVDHVNEVFGAGTAELCTWYVKDKGMVKEAKA